MQIRGLSFCRGSMQQLPCANTQRMEYAVTLIDGHDVLTALQVFKELGILVTASDDEDIYYEMPTQGSKLSLNDSPTFRAVGSGL